MTESMYVNKVLWLCVFHSATVCMNEDLYYSSLGLVTWQQVRDSQHSQRANMPAGQADRQAEEQMTLQLPSK